MNAWKLFSAIIGVIALSLPVLQIWRYPFLSLAFQINNFALLFAIGLGILLFLALASFFLAKRLNFWVLPALLLLLFLSWQLAEYLPEAAVGTQGMPRRYYDYMPLPK